MIFSPAKMSLDDGKTYEGVFLETEDFDRVLALIDGLTANGLMGDELALLVHLKEAGKELNLHRK